MENLQVYPGRMETHLKTFTEGAFTKGMLLKKRLQ
jgi:hypothetical protein